MYNNSQNNITQDIYSKWSNIFQSVLALLIIISVIVLYIVTLILNQKNDKTKLSKTNLALKIIKNILSLGFICFIVFYFAPQRLGIYFWGTDKNIILRFVFGLLSMSLFILLYGTTT